MFILLLQCVLYFSSSAIDFELNADTVYQQKEGNSRLVFRDTGLSVRHEKLKVVGNKLESYILDVKVS